MKLSYWEYKTWLSDIDYAIVGSGITGLNCALSLKERHPRSKILILERGILPNGASTKNAGFTCFGSISEILSDLEQHREEEVLELIKKRIEGLKLLRKNLGDETIGYFQHGGYELFSETDEELFQRCKAEMDRVNRMLLPVLRDEVFSLKSNVFGFGNIQEGVIFNPHEGQLDTGKMMAALLSKVQSKGVQILTNTTLEEFIETSTGVTLRTTELEIKTKKLLLATNGFASQLGIKEVKPARAQVLITKPIPDLKIRGTFHLDQGYYYFRNIDNRILLGGGRNLDFKTEETTEMGETELIQNKLKEMLQNIILPQTPFEIDQSWSGIMGVGGQKKPVVKRLSDNVSCAVRLGGMGVAIGSLLGKELAELAD